MGSSAAIIAISVRSSTDGELRGGPWVEAAQKVHLLPGHVGPADPLVDALPNATFLGLRKADHFGVVKDFLAPGDTITIRFGDRRQGSPGIRLQTYCESEFEFRVLADPIATYDYVAIAESPKIAIVPGPGMRWRAKAASTARATSTVTVASGRTRRRKTILERSQTGALSNVISAAPMIRRHRSQLRA